MSGATPGQVEPENVEGGKAGPDDQAGPGADQGRAALLFIDQCAVFRLKRLLELQAAIAPRQLAGIGLVQGPWLAIDRAVHYVQHC